MLRRVTLWIFIALSWSACENSTSIEDRAERAIQQQEVENVLATLSADEMKGRSVLRPEIERTEDYIISQFEEAGLEYYDKDRQSYRYPVRYNVLSHQQSSLTLNGETVPLDSYVTHTYHEALDWPNLSSMTTMRAGSSDDFDEVRIDAINHTEDVVVLVDPSHQEDFESSISLYRDNVRTLHLNTGTSTLFILTTETSIQSGSYQYEASIDEAVDYNIVGKISGQEPDTSKVLFTAHYDHLGIAPEPVAGDSIYNGADDNASGTTALIMLAKYFRELDQPQRTIWFVAFTAEEIGLYGSRYMARQMDANHIAALINFEMIGKESTLGSNVAYLTGFDKSNMGQILQSNLEGTDYRIDRDPYPDYNLYYRSDNAPFAIRGVPAHSISTVPIDNDPYYHTVDDELNTLDLTNLTQIIRGVAIAAEPIVEGEDRPTQNQSGHQAQETMGNVPWQSHRLNRN
ncbi:MAG: M28 family metallopeptidase [Bacteroidota bacterium]